MIALRPARSTDAGKLGEMITRAVAAHDWKPVLHTGAEDIAHAGRLIDRGWVTVAVDADDRVAGFLAREGGYIHALFVAPQAQGKGAGTALIAQAKRDCDRLELWTFQANRGARRFYEREGFAEAERSDGARNEEGLPDIRFTWAAGQDAVRDTAPGEAGAGNAAAGPDAAPSDPAGDPADRAPTPAASSATAPSGPAGATETPE
ncbi:GNAT family N-acetyltransferase [Pseudoponticoccus marisrubri]|uniref:GNAT family N-acetyltransferase n=1 Tax=Pseudoponticoccus marisrubri TaxID=1685382 RepID=UPI00268E77CD